MLGEGDIREAIILGDTHLLVTGGPGSGKTTVALLKAERHVRDGLLMPGQRILFLSFARATVARVIEAAKENISKDALARIDVDTYHGFAWRLIKCHGYLVNTRFPRLLTPADVAARFSDVDPPQLQLELRRLWEEDGLLGFDLFAEVALGLITSCKRLGDLYSCKYPLFVIDEFQDTNAIQWGMVQALTNGSQVLALADPDQRIYEFAGADPKRIGEFIEGYSPTIVDLASQNHRSGGTDIAVFGNDLLTGANRGKGYSDVKVKLYQLGKGRASPEFALKTEVFGAMKRLIAGGGSWSIAVLVPTQATMLAVARYFAGTEDELPVLGHQVHVDQEGPCLAAAIIAGLLEGGTPSEVFERLILQLRSHVRGRKGRKPPSQTDLGFSVSVADITQLASIKKKDQRLTVEACRRIANGRQTITLTGAPEDDWRAMVELLRGEQDGRIVKVVEDARFIRLLNRGSNLRQRLNELWRRHRSYSGARAEVEAALTQLHLAQNHEDVRGVHLMTIHKSKGKEYDEVILYEGPYQGKFVFGPNENDIARARLLLRVGVTRARTRTTILTPKGRVCPLL